MKKKTNESNVEDASDETKEESFYTIWEKIKENVTSNNSDSPFEIMNETAILDERSEDFYWKIVLAGDGAVGKTSIRKRYLGENFSGHYQHTIGADFAVYEDKIGWKKIKFVIWDLAGQLRFHEVRKSFYRGAHGALVVFDLTNIESFERLRHWVNEIWKNSTKGPIPFVIVGNKVDLRDLGMLSVSDEIIQKFTYNCAQETRKQYGFGTKSVITSAKTGDNVREAFRQLAIQIIAHSRYLEK